MLSFTPFDAALCSTGSSDISHLPLPSTTDHHHLPYAHHALISSVRHLITSVYQRMTPPTHLSPPNPHLTIPPLPPLPTRTNTNDRYTKSTGTVANAQSRRLSGRTRRRRAQVRNSSQRPSRKQIRHCSICNNLGLTVKIGMTAVLAIAIVAAITTSFLFSAHPLQFKQRQRTFPAHISPHWHKVPLYFLQTLRTR